MLTAIVAVLVFTGLVVIHEFGHYIMAKLSGIKVEEFAVGMGPKLFGVKPKETLFTIRAFPLGGFCKMLGEDESNDDPRAFNNKPVLKRIAVIAFGPIMNFILALAVFSIVFAQLPIVESTVAGKPADAAGIVAGDKIIQIADTTIDDIRQVNVIISENVGKTVRIVVQNKGEAREVFVVPEPKVDGAGAIIGVGLRAELSIKGFSVTEGFKNLADATSQILAFLGRLIVGRANTEEVEGPVGIVKHLGDAAKIGFIPVIFFMGILSLNLAVINLLPFPALDGGRLVFLFLELIRRKPVDQNKEGFLHLIGFVALMALSVLIIFRDLIRYNIINFFR